MVLILIIMCLAIPGKVLEINGVYALVDFNGVKRSVVIGLTPNAKIGNYVIVHAGYAIQVMNEEDAKESLSTMKDLVDELDIDEDDFNVQ
jgi:hydrogenase expression/formation protein HypC